MRVPTRLTVGVRGESVGSWGCLAPAAGAAAAESEIWDEIANLAEKERHCWGEQQQCRAYCPCVGAVVDSDHGG